MLLCSINYVRGRCFLKSSVLLCFIKPILGNRYVRSRGFIFTVLDPDLLRCMLETAFQCYCRWTLRSENRRLSGKSTSTRDTFNTREWQTTGLRSLWPRWCPGVHYYWNKRCELLGQPTPNPTNCLLTVSFERLGEIEWKCTPHALAQTRLFCRMCSQL